MDFTTKSCRAFVAELASETPVPGGGGAAAMVGAMGLACGNMVGSLTVGKQKYARVQEEMLRLKREAQEVQDLLLELVNRDAEVFVPLSRAYSLPKETEAERVAKAYVLEQALREAASVPVQIMSRCMDAIILVEQFAAKGTAMAISDAGSAAALCKAALQAASLNVFINTNLMKDRDYANELNLMTQRLLESGCAQAEKVFEQVKKRLIGQKEGA